MIRKTKIIPKATMSSTVGCKDNLSSRIVGQSHDDQKNRPQCWRCTAKQEQGWAAMGKQELCGKGRGWHGIARVRNWT